MTPDRYSNRTGARAPSRGPAFDPELPVAGCYRVKIRAGAPSSAIRIFLDHPTDPESGERMLDRGFVWQAARNGQPIDVFGCWPQCARDPIDQAEHDRIVARNATMDETSPFYDVRQPIDLFHAPTPF